MRVYADATTVISLGTVDELGLLTNFDCNVVVLPAVFDEVTTEPARTNLGKFVETEEVKTDASDYKKEVDKAREVLDENKENGDVQIVAAVLAHKEAAVVSDDRRVRTVCDGLGATVTGTVGMAIRAVKEGMSAEKAKDTVRRVDEHGLHMTAELREKAYDLIEKHA